MRSAGGICGRSLRSMLLAMLFALACPMGQRQGTFPNTVVQGYMEDARAARWQVTPALLRRFRIYPLATGGAVLWSDEPERHFDKGNYSVLLGQAQNLSGQNLSAVWKPVAAKTLRGSTVTINGTPATILPACACCQRRMRFWPRSSKRGLGQNVAGSRPMQPLQPRQGSPHRDHSHHRHIATTAQSVQSVNVQLSCPARSPDRIGPQHCCQSDRPNLRQPSQQQCGAHEQGNIFTANRRLRQSHRQRHQTFTRNFGIGISTTPNFPLARRPLGDKIV